jgi:hypothetical protein
MNSQCVCFMLVGFCSFQSAISVPLPEMHQDKRTWAMEAEQMVTELRRLASEADENEHPSWPSELEWSKMLADETAADKLLWRLWLRTGMPPLLRDTRTEPLAKYLRRNLSAYQAHISEHSNMTAEEVSALGLANAIEAFGSPLWYMTLRYLFEMTGVDTHWQVIVQSTPNRFLVASPINDEAASSQRAALARWLQENLDDMVWDGRSEQFRPRSGTYRGSDTLFQDIGAMVFQKE